MTNEELQQEVEKLQEQISKLSLKIYGIEAKKKPYEVEVPDDIENYYIIDETGALDYVFIYAKQNQKEVYQRGLAFERRVEAKEYDKERILLFKLHKWAEEHNGGWNPNLNDEYEKKYFIIYHVQDKIFEIFHTRHYNYFLKLPYFKTVEIAEQFIEEFGDEIKEVLYKC